MTNSSTPCEICGAPQAKIVDGHAFCGHQRHTATALHPEIPIIACQVCRYPARRRIDDHDLCRDHEPKHLPPALATRVKQVVAAAIAALLLLASPARATVAGYTIGTSPVQVIAPFASPGAQYRLIIIANGSDDVLNSAIACAWDGATPALNSAGSFTIAPGATMTWSAANVTFGSAISCVAAKADTPVTAQVQ